MQITITLTPEAAAGWQDYLDTVVNPSRDANKQLPHTLQQFFQEAEEAVGVQRYVTKLKREKYEAAKLAAGLSDKEFAQLAQIAASFKG